MWQELDSNDGDVRGHNGSTNSGDCWVVKLAAEKSEVAAESDARGFLLESFPNPFSASTHITAAGASHVSVVNALGDEIVSLAAISPGEFIWTPEASVPAGIYFMRAYWVRETALMSVMLTR